MARDKTTITKTLSIKSLSDEPIEVAYRIGRSYGGYLRRGRKEIILVEVNQNSRSLLNELTPENKKDIRVALCSKQ